MKCEKFLSSKPRLFLKILIFSRNDFLYQIADEHVGASYKIK